MLAVVVTLGLAALPGAEDEPEQNPTLESLAEPVIATTSTTLSARSVAVMADATFPLIPVNDLDGFVQLAGPIEFGGKHWVAGNHSYPSAEVTILSSVDGARWEAEASVSAGDGEWLRIDDLGSFGGVLMAVGTVGRADGPAYAPSTAGSVVLWKSGDGLGWSPLPIAEDPPQEYSNLQLATGSEEVLITGSQSAAFETSVLEQIPTELVPGLERGDFQWWFDPSRIRVVAPPGIELFSTPIEQDTSLGDPNVMFRSDNLLVWEQIPGPFSTWMATTTFDDGFVSSGYDGEILYSANGRTWEPTDRFPPLMYQNWGDRLVGLDYSVAVPRLVVFGDEEAATIELPSEITDNQYGGSVTGGPSGLATVLWSYDQTYVEPIAQIDGFILILDSAALRIEEPSGETSFASFDNNGLIQGSYVPETDSIRFETTDGSKSFEFPVAVLLDLRGRSQPGRFEVFLSDDGLVWAQAQTGLRADQVDILGSAGQTFLVALRHYSFDYRLQPITVYRTGPVG